MDPLSTLATIFTYIQKIQDIVDTVEGNKNLCARLGARFADLLPSLTRLRRNQAKLNEECCRLPLTRLLNLSKDACVFLARFTSKNYFIKAWSRTTDKETFVDFNNRLTDAVTDLNLGYAVDTRAQQHEDAEDTRKDIVQGLAMVEDELERMGSLTSGIREQINSFREEQLAVLGAMPQAVAGAVEGIVRREMRDTQEAILQVRDLILMVQGRPSRTREIRLHYLRFSEERQHKLGSGAFSDVYRGTYNGDQVAVKVVRPHETELQAADVENEVKIHQSLDSPNIIRLYGAVFDNNRCIIVTELAMGSLHDYLYSRRVPLERSLAMNLYILADIGRAMEFIHSCGVLHRDLKPGNCLLMADGRAKIADFGLSKIRADSTKGAQQSFGQKGTCAYMAPEIFEDPPVYSRKGDVYSFFIMANEVMGGVLPYAGLADTQIIASKLRRDTPSVFSCSEFDEATPALLELQELIEHGFSQDLTRRPPFGVVSPALSRIAKRVCDEDPRTQMAQHRSLPPQDLAGCPSPSRPMSLGDFETAAQEIRSRLNQAWEQDEFELVETLEDLQAQLIDACTHLHDKQRELEFAKEEKNSKAAKESKQDIIITRERIKHILEQADTKWGDSKEPSPPSNELRDQAEPEAETAVRHEAEPKHQQADTIFLPDAKTVVRDQAPNKVKQQESDPVSVLMDLYRSTGGSTWTNSDGWGTERPIHKWFGVKVDGDGRVTELGLANNNMRGTIPASIGNLPNLQKLILYSNELSGSLPSSLGNLTRIWLLDLGNNQFSGVIPETLGNLSKLKQLWLYNNQFSGPVPETLGRLSNLQMLDLSENQLSGKVPVGVLRLMAMGKKIKLPTGLELPENIDDIGDDITRLDRPYMGLAGPVPETLGNLSNLRSLCLEVNKLSGRVPESLGNLSNLQYLHLQSNQLSGQVPETLGNLSNLLGLSLSDNQFSGVIPETLGNLSKLEWLRLDNNQLSGKVPVGVLRLMAMGKDIKLPTGLELPENIDDIGNDITRLDLSNMGLRGHLPSSLGNLTNLRELRLFNNQFSGPVPETLGNLSNLRGLSLSGNQFSGNLPASLGNLPALTHVILYQNQFSGVIPETLGNLTNLEQLFLYNNRLSVSKQERDRIKAALPRCTITF